MLRLSAPCTFKLREKASVFLTELHPATDADARAQLLAALRRRDHDATHHCSAWRQGIPVCSQGADDDGEPAGTAGPPMLRVLEGADVSDVMAICIRWYGGTKLGTGGLVRAYTACLQGAVDVARAQGLFAEAQVLRHGAISVAPGLAHLPFTLLGAFPDVQPEAQIPGTDAFTLRFAIPPHQADAFEKAWQSRSRGGQVTWD